MLKYFEKMQNEFNFEKRFGQIEMATIVKASIDEERSSIIEAGTGIGKTLAYLIPAVLDAKKNGKRVVVSTNTINLQEQLLEKDLPLVEKIIDEKIEYSIVKGRSNYVCGNRLLKNTTNKELIKWFEKTKTGDRSEIDFNLSNEEWQNVCSDADFCFNFGCSKTDNCFFYKSRKGLQNKTVLVVNHSLLFSSFKYEGLLPKYDTLILDEAHNIEAVARNYFEIKISSREMFKNIGMLHNSQTKLGYVRRVCTELKNLGANQEEIDNIFLDISETLNSIYEIYVNMVNNLIVILNNNNKYNIRKNKIENQLEKYYSYISRLKDKYILLSELYMKIKKKMDDLLVSDDVKSTFYMIFNKVYEDLTNLFDIQDEDTEKSFTWFRYDNLTQDVCIINTPIDISSQFDELLSDKVSILTSATLQVNNSFEYLRSRLGLENFSCYWVRSPFDYDKNMRILISTNKYNPNSSEYLEYTVDFLHKYLKENKNGTFILCTSYKQVEYLYNNLKLEGFNVLKHGNMSRTNLIDNFKNVENSVLIGTDSFWEGVDVKGERLKNVIIVKLPFVSPDDPTTEAISENLQKRGKNPFMVYQLPLMIIKLKQGIGRLIRSEKDSGDVVILDNRVYTKRYGKNILNSLPSRNIEKVGEEYGKNN